MSVRYTALRVKRYRLQYPQQYFIPMLYFNSLNELNGKMGDTCISEFTRRRVGGSIHICSVMMADRAGYGLNPARPLHHLLAWLQTRRVSQLQPPATATAAAPPSITTTIQTA